MGKNIGGDIYNRFYEAWTFGIFLGIFRYVSPYKNKENQKNGKIYRLHILKIKVYENCFWNSLFFKYQWIYINIISKEIWPNLAHFHMPKKFSKKGNLQIFHCTGT